MDITIRHTTVSDEPETLKIRWLGWLSAYPHIFGVENINKHFENKDNDPAYHEECINRIKTNPNNYVAEADGKVVATMIVKEVEKEDDFVEVMCLYVHPDYHRLGIGGKLYSLAKDIAKEHGIHKIHIEALKDNHIGCSFYKKNGGKIISERIRECCGISATNVMFEFKI